MHFMPEPITIFRACWFDVFIIRAPGERARRGRCGPNGRCCWIISSVCSVRTAAHWYQRVSPTPTVCIQTDVADVAIYTLSACCSNQSKLCCGAQTIHQMLFWRHSNICKYFVCFGLTKMTFDDIFGSTIYFEMRWIYKCIKNVFWRVSMLRGQLLLYLLSSIFHQKVLGEQM